MKKPLLTIAILFTLSMQGQDLSKLISEYEKYCGETVLDTVIQSGTITEKMVKVKGTDYYAVQLDTVWNDVDCPEYKDYDTNFYLGSQTLTYITDAVLSASYATTGAIQGTERAKDRERAINRDYVCECKRREVSPFSEHFWNWIKKHTNE